MQRIIRTESKNRDPFKSAKLREMILARQLSERYAPREAGLAELIKFAAKGNSLDFFMNIDQLQKEMQADVYFSINHIENLAKELAELGTQHGSTIVYLADNAGECYFDLPLIKKLEQYAAVYYAVKSAPVQNDLTLPDLMASGIKEEIPRVITTGTDTPGLDLNLVSDQFRSRLNAADLLICKGMGYYETVPELSLNVPAFMLLKAKCAPVARSLDIPLNSYAAFFIHRSG